MNGFQLPNGVNVVATDQWRDEMFRRGVLDRDSPNPRQDFKRIRETLQARNLIGCQDGHVWSV